MKSSYSASLGLFARFNGRKVGRRSGIAEHAMPAMEPSFAELVRSGDVFTGIRCRGDVTELRRLNA